MIEKNKIRRCVLTLSSELEIWSFHVVEFPRTEKKCTNFHTIRAERLFFSLIGKGKERNFIKVSSRSSAGALTGDTVN